MPTIIYITLGDRSIRYWQMREHFPNALGEGWEPVFAWARFLTYRLAV